MAKADGMATGNYQLTARVDVACWVRSEQTAALQVTDNVLTGRVVEACNNPAGFLVSASYRTLATDEQATLRYGDRVIGLPRSGQAMLRRSNMAQIRTVSYSIESLALDEPLVLAFSIQPL